MAPVLDKMRDHLIAKNVAAEIAGKLCDSVAAKLNGKVWKTSFSNSQEKVNFFFFDDRCLERLRAWLALSKHLSPSRWYRFFLPDVVLIFYVMYMNRNGRSGRTLCRFVVSTVWENLQTLQKFVSGLSRTTFAC